MSADVFCANNFWITAAFMAGNVVVSDGPVSGLHRQQVAEAAVGLAPGHRLHDSGDSRDPRHVGCGSLVQAVQNRMIAPNVVKQIATDCDEISKSAFQSKYQRGGSQHGFKG